MALKEWIDMRRVRLETMGVSIIESTELKIRFEHYMLKVMFPGCLVMVTEGTDEQLQDMINDLNDRMSSHCREPDVPMVLDHLLDTLESFQGNKLDVVKFGKHVQAYAMEDDNEYNDENEGEDDMFGMGAAENDEEDDSMESQGDDDDDDDHDCDDSMRKSCNKNPGSLYFLAANASSRCSSLKSSSCSITSVTDMEEFYKYCIVTDPARSGNWVRMEVDFASLLAGSPVTEPLDMEGTLPTVVTLDFDIQSWNTYPFTKTHFKPSQVEVVQQEKVGQQQEKHGQLRIEYGSRVLIPTLIKIFMSYCNSGELSVPTTNHVMVEALQRAACNSNPILGLLYFVTSQVWMLPAWCPLCCSLLPFRPYKLLSCQADKCMFEFQEQGLASSALAQIKKTPEVVALDIAFFISAARCKRDVLEPFPSFLLKERELRKQNGWFGVEREPSDFCSNFQRHKPRPGESNVQNKMLSLIQDVLFSMPTVKNLAGCKSETELREYMSTDLSTKIQKGLVKPPGTVENPHRLSYKLLSYCLSSNRISLQLLEGEEKLDFGSKCENIHQYVVLHDTPEKEAIKEQLPEGKSSIFAFHGSSFGNWYSILRNGIRCMSMTKYMSNGAGSGDGIYCSHSLRESLRYSGYNKDSNWEFAGYACVAIVQVYHNEFRSIPYVIPKEYEDRVLLRYLLLCPPRTYPIGKIAGSKLNHKTDLEDHHKKQTIHFDSMCM